MRLKQAVYIIATWVLRWYWKIFKPQTFGVRALLKNSQNPDQVLLIRHTYGNRTLWNIPGGGYNPQRESAEMAILREVQEEIGVIPSEMSQVGEYKTNAEGKEDTIKLFVGVINEVKFELSDEIAESVWQNIEVVKKRVEVAKVVGETIKKMDLV